MASTKSTSSSSDPVAEDRGQSQVRFRTMPFDASTSFFGDFPGFSDGMCLSEPGGFFMSGDFANHAAAVRQFRPRPDDVWVVTFAKCGTTWTQEMVWMIVNDCDYEGGKADLNMRSPFLEFSYLLPTSLGMKRFALAQMDKLPSPRVMKSHLSFDLLNAELLDTCKVVYVARNPKDVIVSYFHHYSLMKFVGFKGSLAQFADYFMKDQVLGAPFFPHVLAAWNLRHHPNLHFIFYEDMKRDLRGEIKKVADFLQKPLTEEQLDGLTEHLRIDNFAKNEAVNKKSMKNSSPFFGGGDFIRKGKTGDWKNHFDAELNERIDRWIEANLAGSDLKFVTELERQD